MKTNIDFSEVSELKNGNKDTFYLDVLTNSHIKARYNFENTIDLYFFEEFQIARKDLNSKEYYERELDKIIQHIDDINIAGGYELNTEELIEQKNEMLAILEFEFISHRSILRIQKKIRQLKSMNKKINFESLNAYKTEFLSQFPKIDYTIRVIAHYNIIDGKALPVTMDSFNNLKRVNSGNNIYLPNTTEKNRRVYQGFKMAPRAGQGLEFTFIYKNKKWVVQNSKMTWIS